MFLNTRGSIGSRKYSKWKKRIVRIFLRAYVCMCVYENDIN